MFYELFYFFYVTQTLLVADLRMEASKECLLDEVDTGASGNGVFIHKGANPQSQVDPKEGSEKGKGTLPDLDTERANEKFLSQYSRVNSAEISNQEAEKPELLSQGELKSYSWKIDGRHDQQDSAMPKERSLEVKMSHQMAQNRTDGTTVVPLAAHNETKDVDMSNDMTPIDSSSGDEPTEETLVNEVKDTVLSTGETEETMLSKEITGLESVSQMEAIPSVEVERELLEPELNTQPEADVKTPRKTFLLDTNAVVGNETGTEEEQAAFMKELEAFHKERCLEFKPPKFYGEPLNCLKSVLLCTQH